MSNVRKHKIFNTLGWAVIAAGVVGGILSYFFISSQDFVVALLARVVEQPFEYRSLLAMLTAAIVTIVGCLIGLIYLGLAEVMRRES